MRTGAVKVSANPEGMASALLMVGPVRKAMQYAVREDEFVAVFSAGAFLVLTGTVAHRDGCLRARFELEHR